jgi:ubiquinone/menaquinone biosynthesis C-methylase UbiE
MVLTSSQAKAFYDRFGSKQDAQAFYEDAALDDLIAHAKFELAERVFEFGCGTGRLAARLLSKHLSPSASYLGVDLSETMIDLAKQRLSPFIGRARVKQSDGAMRFPLPDRSVDRVVSAYVLDLLSDQDMRDAASEAQRVLKPAGKLCLVSLTHGVTPVSRIVSALWSMTFRLRASLVGGCRPIRLASYFAPPVWSLDYRNVVTRFGISSEVLVVSSNGATALNPDEQRRNAA